MTRPTRIIASAAVMGLALAAPAFAHTGVGVWAAQLGKRATWVVPAAFVAVMIAGAGLALAGAPLPLVEFGIAGSVLVIGALIAFGTRMPVGLAMALVGLFALFHGHAHGTELPGFAHPAAYGAGFLAATALLHVAGVGIALAVRKHAAKLPFRVAGAAMAVVGGGLLLGA